MGIVSMSKLILVQIDITNVVEHVNVNINQ
jgi:hypothetical protein